MQAKASNAIAAIAPNPGTPGQLAAGSSASVFASYVSIYKKGKLVNLILEQTIAATTLSETAQLLDNLVTLDLSLPAGYVVNVTIGTTVAAGLQVTGVGGNY